MAEVKIRAESCKSCKYCVHFCPKGVLEVGTQVNSKGYPYVVAAHPEKCIGCAMLGVYIGYTQCLPENVVLDTIVRKLGKKASLIPMNKEAFAKGLEIGRKAAE